MAGIRKKTWETKDGKSKSCYEITYYIDGKLYRKAGYKTKQAALTDCPNITKTMNSSITFKQLADEYIANRKIRCKNSTIIKYNNYLHCNLSHLNNKKAKDIKKLDIEKTVQMYSKNGLSNKTIDCIFRLGF